jgi:hypothetical protein
MRVLNGCAGHLAVVPKDEDVFQSRILPERQIAFPIGLDHEFHLCDGKTRQAFVMMGRFVSAIGALMLRKQVLTTP